MDNPSRRFELVPIDDLVDDPRNPKGHDDDALDRSIDVLGYIEPIVEDERTGRLISGHGRKGALIRRRESGMPPPDGIEVVDGVWHAWVVRGWSSTDDDHAAAALVALNTIGPRGGWVPERVDALLSSVDAKPDLVELMAWDRAELDGLLEKARATDPSPDPDDFDPGPEPDPVCAAGDVWALGPHRLVIGDSTDPAVAALATGGRRADLVFTDPPYGIAYRGVDGSRKPIANDDLGPDELSAFLRAALSNALAVSRPGACWFVCAPSGPLQVQFGVVLLELGIYRATIVWVKDRHVLGRGDYHHRTELVFHGWTPGAEPTPPKPADGDVDFLLYGWAGGAAHTPTLDRLQTDVWEIPRPARSEDHPTMKPVELVERALRHHSTPGDLVLDLFGGSGSTLIAAHRTKRVAALVELDPGYGDVICRRWQETTGDLPVRVAGASHGPHDFARPGA